MSRPGRLKLAVVANEFFAPEVGRMGGFGWAARQVARCFAAQPELGVDVIFLTGELRATPERGEVTVHGTRLLLRRPSRLANVRMLRGERPDLLLTIDYRPSYRLLLWSLPRTPVIVWARDPRTPEDVRWINTLRIPGVAEPPRGIIPVDYGSLATIVRWSRFTGRRVLVASKMPHIAAKAHVAYGVRSSGVLPNPGILDQRPPNVPRTERPSVVFLARLDPYKRPWLFIELARRFPEADFLILGQTHFTGPGSWAPRDLPSNVRLLGHCDGAEKIRILSASWVLVNTSIAEESPVSMLEALACGTPILSCVGTGDLAARFGVFTGAHPGDGLDALPAMTDGLRTLLKDDALRSRLGAAGRQWVEAEHSRDRFLESFASLSAMAGVRVPFVAARPTEPQLAV